MAIPQRYGIEKKLNSIEGMRAYERVENTGTKESSLDEKEVNGGKGSGNFGHAGRPGEVGGSGKGEGVGSSEDTADLREAEADKAKSERAKHIKQIDEIIGKEKIRQGETKAEDDANLRKLERDIDKIRTILSKEKSRENFGQEEIRKLKDKYSDYMSGNWSVTGSFQERIRSFEDWADNYQNY